MRIIIVFLIMLVIVIFNSCWLLPLPKRVEIIFPSLPDSWKSHDLCFSICYFDEQDQLQWMRDLSPEASTFLTLSKKISPVTAYPHLAGETAPVPGMKPAGSVFLLDNTDCLELQWIDGALAELLARLTSDQRKMINIKKLREALRGWDDPWVLDREVILDALLFHRFTGSVFKEYSLYFWEDETTGWWGDPLLQAEAEGVYLYPGIHRLNIDGGSESMEKLQINITSLGWTVLDLVEGTIERGYWE